MGRDLAHRMFARTLAVLGLAAITTIGLTGSAGAAPADRATDPVVLKGANVPTLIKVVPKKILGFRWTGQWEQIPVQVDERHVVNARSVYPEENFGYVSAKGFPVEIYADAKTRSGADADPTFDADDELVFMGGDSGTAAPEGALAPEGVVPASATKIAVADPVGGGAAYVYLFEQTGDIDPSAGKDYVQYDFKLTKFGPGDTLIDDYGFNNSGNPEDSTVKTANYELHSVDRWMEDELKITSGGAPGIDILDREATSAGGLNGCGRSEYTFSANWTLDANPGNDGATDGEGAYISVIDGPVRAVRSYFGANSGPYVEDVHLYYADREDRTINVRVHVIPDMTVWTDYNASATGMTYRDQKNLAGVTVDGVPDTLTPATMADFQNGKYLWQQVSGAAGTTTTMVAADSSADPGSPPDFGFAGYYLDKENPSNGNGERQCGGDMKAYGASGFGIEGNYPNTDPILAIVIPEAKLSVNRVRYFGAPNQSAQDADAYRARVQDPLAGSASGVTLTPRTVKVSFKVQGKPKKAKRGKAVKIKVRAANSGTVDAKAVKVCVTGKGIKRKTCRTVASLAPGKAKVVTLSPRVKKAAKGRKLKLKVATSVGGKGTAGVRLTIPFRR